MQLLVSAEKNVEEVAPAHDARDPAALVDHHKAPDVPLLHQVRGLPEARIKRDGDRRRGHEVGG
ncbi:MAG: hypothetical protein QOI23_2467, partial [Chloroflexota bacterium]|nr:hypothetical protein [Chloroflexota bacterium]